MEITQAMAEKVLATVDVGLVSGLGAPEPGKMCMQAAVCYALGLPHGDKPLTCVDADVNRLIISLNDRGWSSEQARAKGMRRVGVAQLGSAGVIDGQAFRRCVINMTIRKAVPSALRSAAAVNPTHAEALEAAAVRCEQEGTREACQHARTAAAYAAADAASDAAAASAYAAAYAASAYADAAAAASASAAAAAAASDAAAAYAAAAYAAAAYVDAAADAAARWHARDAFLSRYAEWVVEILIEMDAPGCQWLTLAPKAA